MAPHDARTRVFWVLLLTVALVLFGSRLLPAAGAGPCDAPIANPIACENSKAGNPASEWDIPAHDMGDPNIQGYAATISVDQGQTVQFKVKTPANNYRLDIYRLGYHGGLGARKIATVQPSASLPQSQPACLTNAAVGLVDCGNWAVSASWSIPADAVSGVYIAKLVREDGTTGVSHIIFIPSSRHAAR
ncbi:MAG: N,N-dimethylformamidase beta subunit family domain-containing protein [Dehalococcoidia bacterium]